MFELVGKVLECVGKVCRFCAGFWGGCLSECINLWLIVDGRNAGGIVEA